MIEVTFFIQEDKHIVGFNICGHSGFSKSGSDIVCASVSSAAYMTANTITDVLMLSPKINVSDGLMNLKLTSDDAQKAQQILLGLKLHLLELSKQYKQYLKVIISEV